MKQEDIMECVKAYIHRMNADAEGRSSPKGGTRKYPLDKEGIFEIYGFTRDSRYRGLKLGVVSGRFVDVIAHAVELPGFAHDRLPFSWADGFIEEVLVGDRIIRIPKPSLSGLIKLNRNSTLDDLLT